MRVRFRGAPLSAPSSGPLGHLPPAGVLPPPPSAVLPTPSVAARHLPLTGGASLSQGGLCTPSAPSGHLPHQGGGWEGRALQGIFLRGRPTPPDRGRCRAATEGVGGPAGKASPSKGEAVSRRLTDEGAFWGAPLSAPSSGPSGRLPPCGGRPGDDRPYKNSPPPGISLRTVL